MSGAATTTRPPRPRNVLLEEFPDFSKEAASQALRMTEGDLDVARALLRRDRKRRRIDVNTFDVSGRHVAALQRRIRELREEESKLRAANAATRRGHAMAFLQTDDAFREEIEKSLRSDPDIREQAIERLRDAPGGNRRRVASTPPARARKRGREVGRTTLHVFATSPRPRPRTARA